MRDPARLLVKLSKKLATAGLFVVIALTAATSVGVLEKPRHAYAASSSNLNFQARLLNSAGNVVPDGYYNVEFKLYDVSSGGTALWTDTRYDQNGATAGLDYRLRVVNVPPPVNVWVPVTASVPTTSSASSVLSVLAALRYKLVSWDPLGPNTNLPAESKAVRITPELSLNCSRSAD